MFDPVIRAEGLSKLYRLGAGLRYKSLRETVTERLRQPFARRRPPAETIWALRDVSFRVEAGEVVGIIGRNGAGKSTLLKILSQITEPTAGHAQIRGRIGSLLEVGTGFHQELTGRENIFLNGAILGMRRTEIQKKFEEIVSFAEVERFIDTTVKYYSSGMYLRLAFAVAAHLEPEILLVDEVLAVGDAAFQQKCLGKMSAVAKQGRTVLLVSHNMGAITSLCSRAIHLKEGKIREDGPSGGVVNRYLSEVLSGADGEIARFRLPGLGDEVHFVGASLRGGVEATIPFRSPLVFDLVVESEREFEDLSVGASVLDTIGGCVGTLFSTETFSIKQRQRLNLKLTVSNLALAPGLYHMGFSIGRGGKTSGRCDLDIIIGVPVFQVLPIGSSDEVIANWDRRWGSIVIEDCSLLVEGRTQE